MNTLQAITDAWRGKLQIASDSKKREFGERAAEAMAFYNGPHDFMYEDAYARKARSGCVVGGDNFPAPPFKMTVNKVAEAVQLYLPVLYHRNPTRQVNPRVIQPPQELLDMGIGSNPVVTMQDKVRAWLLQHYQNHTPHELNLREDARKSLVEAIVKGRGLLWTMLFDGPRGRMVGSFYDTVDNLLIDPDAEDLRHAQWVARRRCEPVSRVERKFGLPRGALKPNYESLNQQAVVDSKQGGAHDRATGGTNDQLVYYEVFSRMGVGGRLQGADEQLRDMLEDFGDAAYLVIADGIEYPLNLPPEIGQQPDAENQVKQRLMWPTPFHEDAINPWPFSQLDFYTVPRKAWPESIIGFALGEQKFLNWAYSFLAGKIQKTCNDIIAYPKDMDDTVGAALRSNKDLKLVGVEPQAGGTVKGMIEWVQAAQMNGDIWLVIQAVERNFERRTGLTELMYGQTAHQYRSAEEASVKEGMLNVRPDYMAECVESWMTQVAAKEGLAARYHLDARDVAPIFGEQLDPTMQVMGPFTQLWMNLVRQDDMLANAAELEYRIEAGSARKPNKDRDRANIDESARVIFPALDRHYQMTGDSGPINSWLREWARTRDIRLDLVQFPDMQQFMAQQQAMAQQQQGMQQPPRQAGPPNRGRAA